MTTTAEMKQQAAALRKQGSFQEAADLFRVLWEEHRDECDEWDGWGYAYCLRKLDRPQEALDICRQTYPLKPDFEYLRSLYAWCIYDLEMKRDHAEIERNLSGFLKAANAILELVEPGQYSPYARTVFRVLDYFKSRPSYPAATILEWCDRLQPQDLGDEPGRGPDGKGRMVAYASDREKWYAIRCKALFEAGRYQECIACSQQALAEFSRFHHDNDVWFRWRIALSKAELGEKETAIAELQDLLSRKKDWFIHHRIAQYLLDLGRTDEAWKRAIDAALGPGPSDLGFKWELFLLMGRILQARGEMEQAKKHVLLATLVRQQEDWKIPPELAQVGSEMDVDASADVSARDLHKELRRYWQSLQVADMPQGKGEIKNLLPHGKSGFIRGDNGQDYYFRTGSFQGPRHLLKEGQRVSFYIEENPDPDKRDAAVSIKPEDSK